MLLMITPPTRSRCPRFTLQFPPGRHARPDDGPVTGSKHVVYSPINTTLDFQLCSTAPTLTSYCRRKKNHRLSSGIVTIVAYCYSIMFSILVSMSAEDNIKMDLKENLQVLASEEGLCSMELVRWLICRNVTAYTKYFRGLRLGICEQV